MSGPEGGVARRSASAWAQGGPEGGVARRPASAWAQGGPEGGVARRSASAWAQGIPFVSGKGVRFDDEAPVTVVLVRHGQTVLTVARGYSGSSEPGPPLDETGRRQALDAAALVDRIGHDLWDDIAYPGEVIASPMVRTQQTGQLVAERLGLPFTTDATFQEANFGDWQGLTAEQIEDRWPGLLEPWHTDGTVRPPGPGGESVADVGARVRAGLERLQALGGPRTVVVVSHAVAIRAMLGVTMGANPGSWSQLRVAPASVSIIRLFSDRRDEVAVVGVPATGWSALP